jgi:hypothetical protein
MIVAIWFTYSEEEVGTPIDRGDENRSNHNDEEIPNPVARCRQSKSRRVSKSSDLIATGSLTRWLWRGS